MNLFVWRFCSHAFLTAKVTILFICSCLKRAFLHYHQNQGVVSQIVFREIIFSKNFDFYQNLNFHRSSENTKKNFNRDIVLTVGRLIGNGLFSI